MEKLISPKWRHGRAAECATSAFFFYLPPPLLPPSGPQPRSPPRKDMALRASLWLARNPLISLAFRHRCKRLKSLPFSQLVGVLEGSLFPVDEYSLSERACLDLATGVQPPRATNKRGQNSIVLQNDRGFWQPDPFVNRNPLASELL
jgi:hypothetical protein